MKNIKLILLSLIVFSGCDDEVDINPQGLVFEDLIVNNLDTTEGYLIASYGILDGNLDGADVWRGAGSNWIYGEVASDNAYKGSTNSDQPQINQVERYNVISTGDFLFYKYSAVYEGVARANRTIRAAIEGLASNDLSQEDHDRLVGEARFLRGHYHFEAKKMWNKIAFIDENTTESIPNTTDNSVWDRIEADFQAAINLLDETSEDGRANSWMAQAYLAKTHMYQADFVAAKSILDNIINTGPYDLNERYSDNFNAIFDNSNESIFAIQYAVGDGTPNDQNGNWGDVLNFPGTGEAGAGDCCGFYQPSQNLVNAFKTDASGLPLLDTFNNEDVTNEEAQFNELVATPAYVSADSDGRVALEQAYDNSYVPETGNLDPRLDRTVGRKGIDYNGFGLHRGRAWVRDIQNGGPYLAKKNNIQADQIGTSSSTVAWTANVNAINVNIIRFAEVLLWRAEIAASEGDLGTAVQYVDRIRTRAANTADFVTVPDTTTPAANYVINGYGSFSSQEQAIKAVEHEQRIELAMEGNRFFELVRKGTAVEVLNEYLEGEEDNRTYLSSSTFESLDQYYPFPQTAINQSGGVLESN